MDKYSNFSFLGVCSFADIDLNEEQFYMDDIPERPEIELYILNYFGKL